jgi:hypothetical protein
MKSNLMTGQLCQKQLKFWFNPSRPPYLRLGVNFINVKRTNFSYERRFGSFYFYYVYVTRKKAAETMFVRKICAFNVDEIDDRNL